LGIGAEKHNREAG